MRTVLEIGDDTMKNRYQKGDVLLFDGRKWYVTTAKDLLSEALDAFKAFEEEENRKMADLMQEFGELKAGTSEKLREMAALIRELYDGGNR